MNRSQPFHRLILIFISIAIVFCTIIKVSASTQIGLSIIDGLSFREKPSSSSTELLTLPYGQDVTITGSANSSWYSAEIYLNNKLVKGYLYKTSIKIYSYDSSFESQISSFPNEYKEKLRYLHCLFPNWTFKKLNTGLNFSTASTNYQKSALVDGSDTALRQNNTVLEGKTWYRANLATTSYFLDPRNFLIADRALMFESLTYNSNEGVDQVQQLLNGTFMSGKEEISGKSWAQLFVKAGQAAKVSPIYLATRALQEQGTTGTGGLGAQGGKVDGDDTIYFNIFNIGANTGAQDGINYAKTKGWTTRELSIQGGASYIASGYIAAGQQSIYLQRFNVNPSSTHSDPYSHLYMTNIRAPYSEGYRTFVGYYKNSWLNHSRTILIPVFDSMPSATVYPGTMNILSRITSNQSTPTNKKGDVDGNGSISAVDYMLIKNHIMGTATLSGDKLSNADVNKDGVVSAVDYMLIKNHIMGVSYLD